MAVMIARSIKSRRILAVGLHQPRLAGTSKIAQLTSFIRLIVQSNVIIDARFFAVNNLDINAWFSLACMRIGIAIVEIIAFRIGGFDSFKRIDIRFINSNITAIRNPIA